MLQPASNPTRDILAPIPRSHSAAGPFVVCCFREGRRTVRVRHTVTVTETKHAAWSFFIRCKKHRTMAYPNDWSRTTWTGSLKWIVLRGFLLAITMVIGNSKEVKVTNGCDLASQPTNWSMYVSTSHRRLDPEDILQAKFSDHGRVYEAAVTCDPALYFYDESLTTYGFFRTTDAFNSSSIDTSITMLNVSCASLYISLRLTPSDYRQLQSLAVRCNLQNIPPTYLTGLHQLRILDLSRNNLTSVPSELLKDLRQLMILILGDNPLMSLPVDLLCPTTTWLYSIHFNRMFDSYWPMPIFSNATADSVHCPYPSVQLLRLSRNSFHHIPDYAFTRFVGFSNGNSELQIAGSEIETLGRYAFAGLQGLKVLFLEDNRIKDIPEGLLEELSSLTELYLDNNSLSNFSSRSLRKSTHFLALSLSRNDFTQMHVNFDEVIFDDFRYLDVSYNHLRLLSRDTFRVGKTSHLHTLKLGHNRIEEITGDVLVDTPGINELHLEYNLIQHIPSETLSSLKSLQKLYLQGNRIKSLDADSILRSRAAVLDDIRLAENPWECGCGQEAFREFIQTQQDKISDLAQVECESGEMFQDMTSLCPNPYIAPVISLVLLVAILILTLPVVYRYRTEIQILVFIKYGIRLRRPGAKRMEDTSLKDMKYDVFVSFNTHDERFVRQELLPRLEQDATHPYKLCIHYRDFEIGLAIAENIMNAVDLSQRTLLLVSKKFLTSEWCKYEFQMAHHRAMTEGRRRLVVVLMEGVGEKDLSGDKYLASYIKTHTYLSQQDALFWERLIYVLPDRRVSVPHVYINNAASLA